MNITSLVQPKKAADWTAASVYVHENFSEEIDRRTERVLGSENSLFWLANCC